MEILSTRVENIHLMGLSIMRQVCISDVQGMLIRFEYHHPLNKALNQGNVYLLGVLNAQDESTNGYFRQQLYVSGIPMPEVDYRYV